MSLFVVAVKIIPIPIIHFSNTSMVIDISLSLLIEVEKIKL